jgi:hypothetical protein
MPIELNFALSFEDYCNAMRLHAKHNWWRCLNYYCARFVLPVLGIVLLTFGLLISGPGVPWVLVGAQSGLGVFLLFYPLYYRLRLKRCYSRTRIGNGEQSVIITEEGIHVNAENASSDINWKAVQSYLYDNDVFMLYLAPAKFIALPKRILSPEQMSELKSLLSQLIGENR